MVDSCAPNLEKTLNWHNKEGPHLCQLGGLPVYYTVYNHIFFAYTSKPFIFSNQKTLQIKFIITLKSKKVPTRVVGNMKTNP